MSRQLSPLYRTLTSKCSVRTLFLAATCLAAVIPAPRALAEKSSLAAVPAATPRIVEAIDENRLTVPQRQHPSRGPFSI